MGVVRDFASKFTTPIGPRFMLPASTPEPIETVQPNRGGYALFYDEDERVLLFAKVWPHTGVPQCPATNSSTWVIESRTFVPSRRDTWGNWVFRRCGN